MAEFSKIIASSLDRGLIGVDENNVMYCLTDEALKIWDHFSKCDVNDTYTCRDVSKMLHITIAFQYHWLDKNGNFNKYGIIHKEVMDYIFDNFKELLDLTVSQIVLKIDSVFNKKK